MHLQLLQCGKPNDQLFMNKFWALIFSARDFSSRKGVLVLIVALPKHYSKSLSPPSMYMHTSRFLLDIRVEIACVL